MIIEKQYNGEGIGGELAANNYLCSFLNYLPRLVPERVVTMQKHTESDETFVLLKGKAALFLADGQAKPENITFINWKKKKVTLFHLASGMLRLCQKMRRSFW